MTEMPGHRENLSIEVMHVWQPNTDRERNEFCTITYSLIPDDTPTIGEVFITYDQGLGRGSHQEFTGKDVGKLISLALQAGVPLLQLRDAMDHSPVNRMGQATMMPHSLIGSILDTLAEEQGLPPVTLPDDPVLSPGDGLHDLTA